AVQGALGDAVTRTGRRGIHSAVPHGGRQGTGATDAAAVPQVGPVRHRGGAACCQDVRGWEKAMTTRSAALAGVLLLTLAASARTAAPEQVPVFVAGQGGYHTYRIPSVIVTKAGTVLAFCEGRKNGRGDAGDIDLVLKRSFDGGKTWRTTQVVWDD